MAFTTLLVTVLIVAIFFLISAIPLYLAVNFLGGKTSLLKTAFITLIAGFIVGVIQITLKTWGGLIAFLVLLWIYHEAFRLKWWKAFVAWLLQFIILAILYMIAAAIGFSLVGLAAIV